MTSYYMLNTSTPWWSTTGQELLAAFGGFRTQKIGARGEQSENWLARSRDQKCRHCQRVGGPNNLFWNLENRLDFCSSLKQVALHGSLLVWRLEVLPSLKLVQAAQPFLPLDTRDFSWFLLDLILQKFPNISHLGKTPWGIQITVKH